MLTRDLLQWAVGSQRKLLVLKAQVAEYVLKPKILLGRKEKGKGWGTESMSV